MKKLLFLLPLIFFLVMDLAGQDTTAARTSSLPSSELRTLEGGVVNSRDILSDTVPIVLTFWATWCRPCIRELNAINDAMDEWAEEAIFRIVAVSIDDARTTNMVRNLVNSRGWTFEVYLDPNSDFRKLMNVVQPPHTFVLYRGNIVYQHTSYAEGDEEELYEVIKKHQR
jgi:cytochrome c biogenesis protein CcmG, thiol:disulfide interchange protein DsbE